MLFEESFILDSFWTKVSIHSWGRGGMCVVEEDSWEVNLSKNRNSQKVNRSSSFCQNMGVLVILENYSEFSVTAVFDIDAVIVMSKNRLRSHWKVTKNSLGIHCNFARWLKRPYSDKNLTSVDFLRISVFTECHHWRSLASRTNRLSDHLQSKMMWLPTSRTPKNQIKYSLSHPSLASSTPLPPSSTRSAR